MEVLKGGLFISAKDVECITGKSHNRALIHLRAVKDALGIKKPKITVKAYCDFENLDYQEVVVLLNPYR
jgi:hypothetical protein